MQQIIDFVQGNLWLCLIALVVIWIVGDELFGISKGIFGDDADDYGFSRSARARDEKTAREAERDFPESDDTVSFDDIMGPGDKK